MSVAGQYDGSRPTTAHLLGARKLPVGAQTENADAMALVADALHHCSDHVIENSTYVRSWDLATLCSAPRNSRWAADDSTVRRRSRRPRPKLERSPPRTCPDKPAYSVGTSPSLSSSAFGGAGGGVPAVQSQPQASAAVTAHRCHLCAGRTRRDDARSTRLVPTSQIENAVHREEEAGEVCG